MHLPEMTTTEATIAATPIANEVSVAATKTTRVEMNADGTAIDTTCTEMISRVVITEGVGQEPGSAVIGDQGTAREKHLCVR